MLVQIEADLVDNVPSSSGVGLVVGVYPEVMKEAVYLAPPIVRVVHLAPTTSESEEVLSLKTLQSSAVNHHTRQLIRTLPGGLQVIGVYATGSNVSGSLVNLAKIPLGHLNKALRKKLMSYQSDPDAPRLFFELNIDGGAGGKCKAWRMRGEELEPVTVDVVPKGRKAIPLLKIETDFDASGAVVQQKEGDKICDGILKFCFFNGSGDKKEEGCDWKTTTLINEKFPTVHTPYEESSSIHILIDKMPSSTLEKVVNGENSTHTDFINHLHLVGKVHLVAYVLEGESTKRAEENLHRDLLRTLFARLEMHCESLVDEDALDNLSGRVFHEIPHRVFVHLGSGVCVSDYLFPGEGPRDCVESFSEILGIQVGEDDIDEDQEGGSYDHDGSKSTSMEELLSSGELCPDSGLKQQRLWLFLIVGAVVVAAGAILLTLTK